MKNKKWLIYLFLFSAFFIVLSAVLAIMTPKKIEVPETDFTTTNKDGTSSQFEDIKFIGYSFEIPSELPIATIEDSELTPAHVEKQLIKDFQLTPLENAANVMNGPKYSLTKDRRNGNYIFAKNEVPDEVKIVDLEQTLEVAQNFLEEYFPNLELTPLTLKTKYYKAGFHLVETTEDAAEVVEIPFTYSINNYPVMHAHEEEFPFKIMVYSDYQIQKVSFQPLFIKLNINQKAETISVYEAVDNINNNNKASIIAAYQDEFGELSMNNIQSGDLKSVVIEYRVDKELGIAYPFYRFKGKLKNKENIQLRAEVITPAIELKQE